MSKRARPSFMNDDDVGDAMDVDAPPAPPGVSGADDCVTHPHSARVFDIPSVTPVADGALAFAALVTTQQPFDVLPVELLFAQLVPRLGQCHIAMLSATSRYFRCMLAPLLDAQGFVEWPGVAPWTSTRQPVRYARCDSVARHQTGLLAVAEGDWRLFSKLMRPAGFDQGPSYGYARLLYEPHLQGSEDVPLLRHGSSIFEFLTSDVLPGRETKDSTNILAWIIDVARPYNYNNYYNNSNRKQAQLVDIMQSTSAVIFVLRVLTYALARDDAHYMERVQINLCEFLWVAYPGLAGSALCRALNGGNSTMVTPQRVNWRSLVYWPFAWSRGARRLLESELRMHGIRHMDFQYLGHLRAGEMRSLHSHTVGSAIVALAGRMALGSTIPMNKHSLHVFSHYYQANATTLLFPCALFPWLMGAAGYETQRAWSEWRVSEVTNLASSAYIEWLCRPVMYGGNAFLDLALDRRMARLGITTQYTPGTLFDDTPCLGARIGFFVGSCMPDLARRFAYEYVAQHYPIDERGDTSEAQLRYAQNVWQRLKQNALGDALRHLAPTSDFLGILYRTMNELHAALATTTVPAEALAVDGAGGGPAVQWASARQPVLGVIKRAWVAFLEAASSSARRQTDSRYYASTLVKASLLLETLQRHRLLERMWFEPHTDGADDVSPAIDVYALRHLAHWLHVCDTPDALAIRPKFVEWITSAHVLRLCFVPKRRSVDPGAMERAHCEYFELLHTSLSHLDREDARPYRTFVFCELLACMCQSQVHWASDWVILGVMADALAKGILCSSPRPMKDRQVTAAMVSLVARAQACVRETPDDYHDVDVPDAHDPYDSRDTSASLIRPDERDFGAGEASDRGTIVRILRLYLGLGVGMKLVAPALIYSGYSMLAHFLPDAYPTLLGASARHGPSHAMLEVFLHKIATMRGKSVDRHLSTIQWSLARFWPPDMTLSQKLVEMPRSFYLLFMALRVRGFPYTLTALLMNRIADVDLANMHARTLTGIFEALFGGPDAKKKKTNAAAPPAPRAPWITAERMRPMYLVLDRIGAANARAKLLKGVSPLHLAQLLRMLIDHGRSEMTLMHVPLCRVETGPAARVIPATFALRAFVGMLLTHGYCEFSALQEAAAAHGMETAAYADSPVWHRADFARADDDVLTKLPGRAVDDDDDAEDSDEEEDEKEDDGSDSA